jgi:DNA polymerase-3 subunit alpha
MIDFIKACEKHEMKFLIAVEFYFALDEVKGIQRSSNHLICIAKNEIGYKNLLKLTKLSNVPVNQGGGFFYKARINEKMLYHHSEGLIVSSACISGPITELLLNGEDMKASILADEMKQNLEHFYLEIQSHSDPKQIEANHKVIELAKRLNIPLVHAMDVHIKDASQKEAYTVNNDLRRGITKSKSQEFNYDLWYKSIEEVYDIYLKQGISEDIIDEAIDSTIEIANLCEFKWEERNFGPPKFCDDAPAELYKLVANGLVKKFGKKIPKEYKERARHEFDTICKMGFASYFLILEDAIRYCNENSVLLGPGRGSGASSLILWLLNITQLDPMKYNLPFSRFLNEERTDTWPDVDTDAGPSDRTKLINYLKQRWGNDMVVQISNYSYLKSKAALKDVGKFYEIPFDEVNKITSLIPSKGFDEDDNPIEVDMDEIYKLTQMQPYIQKYPDLFRLAKDLEGSIRGANVHAGVLSFFHKRLMILFLLQKRKMTMVQTFM